MFTAVSQHFNLQSVNQRNRLNNIYQKVSTYVRKHNPSYLSFGFTYTAEDSMPVPQCVICYTTLPNYLMKPSLLMCHFETKHGDLKHKPLEYFRRKLSNLSASKGQIMSFFGVNMKGVQAF
jgi:hypothetical protein